MSLQSLDIMRLSATTTPPPQARSPQSGEVAKLIDVSKCIGCKACQTACMEWNDLRDEIGTLAAGVYDNPTDLTDQSWTMQRIFEKEIEVNVINRFDVGADFTAHGHGMRNGFIDAALQLSFLLGIDGA